MPKPRASIFEDPPQLDVGGFAPKTTIDTKAPLAEEVRAVAHAAQFRSREATLRRAAIVTMYRLIRITTTRNTVGNTTGVWRYASSSTPQACVFVFGGEGIGAISSAPGGRMLEWDSTMMAEPIWL